MYETYDSTANVSQTKHTTDSKTTEVQLIVTVLPLDPSYRELRQFFMANRTDVAQTQSSGVFDHGLTDWNKRFFDQQFTVNVP